MLSNVFEMVAWPISGLSWINMMIIPTPFINPEITGYGTYFTISETLVSENRI